MAYWEAVGLLDRSAPPAIQSRFAMLTVAIDVTAKGLPGALAALYTYHRLTFKFYRDEYTRCGTCGYVLKGLTEPRCPECGKPI